MFSVIREDTADQFEWRTIEEIYEDSAVGRPLVQRNTVFDDGILRQESFEDGRLKARQSFDDGPAGPDGVKPWASVLMVFDEASWLELRATEYDDGTTKEEFWDQGLRKTVLWYDNPLDATRNAKDWSEIYMSYDQAGRIERRFTEYDDGTTKSEHWSQGLRQSVRWHDNPLDATRNAMDWTEIYISYDQAGKIEQRFIGYDDGSSYSELFAQGIRTQSLRNDSPDNPFNNVWASIYTRFDETGDIENRTTDYDNGIKKYEDFSNGQRSYLRSDDTAENGYGGAKAWSSIEKFYDADGRVTHHITVYDNGIVRDQFYNQGRRTLTQLEDNPQDPTGGGVKPWRSIDTEFDFDGNVVRRYTDFDTGIYREEFFNQGNRVATYLADNPRSQGNGDEVWKTISTTFDTSGRIAQYIQLNDDGTATDKLYSDGVLTSITEYDSAPIVAPAQCSFDQLPCPEPPPPLPGFHDWTSRTTTFDDTGGKVLEVVVYDNLDVEAFIFVDGLLTESQALDGDFDQDWHIQQTFFAANGGVVEVIDYPDRASFPEDQIVLPLIDLPPGPDTFA